MKWPPIALKMISQMFNRDAKSWLRWTLTCSPYNVLPSSLLSVIQFPWFLDFSKLLSSITTQGLCAFCALFETFVQSHYMLSLSPLPFWAATPFLQTSADTSFYEEASTDGHPHAHQRPISFPTSMLKSLLFFSFITCKTACHFIFVWLFENCLPPPSPT